MGSFLTLAGQGARPSFKRHRPAVSQHTVNCILAIFMSCFLNPQGKPAGLQLISNMRDSADVALLTPGVQDGFPS
jgi:hypothetical protein